jgi:[protein-PII] uridylyltransferase
LLLTDSLKTSIRSNVGKWGIHSFCTPSMHDRFRSILRNKGKVGTTLRMMRDLGFLDKYLPEFARMDCVPQLDLASPYTVDELILRAVDVLDEVANSTNPTLQDYHRVLEQITDPSLVYLALLLHGTAKQSGQSHTAKSERLVGRVLQRLNFGSESREDVLLLVREHLLLAQVSQRRDLGECDSGDG